MAYSITEIASILGLKIRNISNANIVHLLTDSRDLFYPETTLFFALETKNNDGHKFIHELYELNVRNFVVEKILPEWGEYTDANFLVVSDALSALQKLAAYHRRRFDIPVIGITGSNGKTVVKEWIYQLIQPSMNIVRSPRSYNSQIGVPLSVWQLDENSELGIFEAGISMPNEMSKLERIIRPTIGIITNIGDAHQENFNTLKQKCLEKLELFINCDIIICEEGDRLIEECLETACLSQKKFSWSMGRSENSPLQIIDIKKSDSTTDIYYSFLQLEFMMTIPFTDDTSVRNATTALAAALYLHAPTEIIREKMSTLEPVAMRLDVRSGKSNTVIINDTYNSDINSLKIALDFLVQRAANTKQKKTLIISDILQSGSQSKSLYSKVYDLISQKGVNRLIGIGPEISLHKKVFQDIENTFYDSTEDFLKSGEVFNFHDEIVLLKGSRSFEFERISTLLEKKTHETVLEINLDAVVHNFNFYRSSLNPHTKIICMVKADGYGSGASEVAKTLQHHKCDYLAVAVADEGVTLRREGIKLPIIVLNPEVNGFDDLFEYKLEPEVYNFRILNAFIRESERRGITDYPIHLKIDTGMHRLGFSAADMPELDRVIKSQRGLRIQSVFSHLAASESWNFDDFTHDQIATFKLIANEIEKICGYRLLRHILNSAGIERFPEEQMDMVRLGVSLYGISASGLNGLRNVCSFKATILQIKDVPKDETVGYGRKGTLDHDARIATIRVGYADGLSRQFGNGKGQVLLNGQSVPFIGNICMDLSMIDITGIDAKEGDTVTIFGENPSVIDLARSIGTIPYEILTSISSRVKHIYFKE